LATGNSDCLSFLHRHQFFYSLGLGVVLDLYLFVLAPLNLLLKVYWLGRRLHAILLQRLFEVVIVYLDEVFLTRQVVLNVCYGDLTSCLDG